MAGPQYKNGHLLKLVEDAGFEVFVTCDKNIDFQQALRGRPFAVLILSVNNLDVMEPHVGALIEAVDNARHGEVQPVVCGKFVPRKFRHQSVP